MDRLPSIEACRQIFQAAAVLDAILSPEWELRYYSYNQSWYSKEEMASMRDGEGSHYFAWFSPQGLMMKGFDHELVEEGAVSIGVDPVPENVAEFLREPAFMGEQTTFCLWNLYSDNKWSADRLYREEDCRLLRLLVEGPEYYQKWASWYYEREVDLETIRRIFAHESISAQQLHVLNPELTLEDLEEDLAEIGYLRTLEHGE
ncbi:hypothetical protein B9G55_06390 [Saccharibacillus sp. O16]|nr:hypothetical protein B9G55_06390 [Saccharibacillus sp. O16]